MHFLCSSLTRLLWAIPAKTGNLEISLREEISRFLSKYRSMKKLEIRKSQEFLHPILNFLEKKSRAPVSWYKISTGTEHIPGVQKCRTTVFTVVQ